MVFRTSPQLGPGLEDVYDDPAFFDGQGSTQVSPQLGSVVRGSDGGEFFWVQASAPIAATPATGTGVTITYPAYTIATGGTTFYTAPDTAIASGQFCWIRRGAWDAIPG